VDRIRISTQSEAAAVRLAAALGEFQAEPAASADGGYEVEVFPSTETSDKLIGLFDLLGDWCCSEDLASVTLHLGDRTFSLVRPVAGTRSDPTQFLLERTIQLQTALESRIVIEQAKGVLAERFGLTVDAAFALLRDNARRSRTRIHDVAREILSAGRSADGDGVAAPRAFKLDAPEPSRAET
jgi:ANTAR domain